MTKRILLDSGEIIEDAPDDACIHGETGRCRECRWEQQLLDRGDCGRDEK